MRSNKSGIYPAGNRVLIKPDPIEDQLSSSVINIPDSIKERYQQAQATGVLCEAGPDAFCHAFERRYHVHGNGERKLFEEIQKGYKEPFAKRGDRIAFAKYSGMDVWGEDGESYKIINDEDITCRVSDGVEFSDLKPREGIRANKGLSA